MYGKVRKSKGKFGKHGKEWTFITNAHKARGLDRKNLEIQVWKQKVFSEPSGGQGVQPTE